jgi:hypothetical protein
VGGRGGEKVEGWERKEREEGRRKQKYEREGKRMYASIHQGGDQGR